MFAGNAEATRMMRYAGHCAAKLDYKYHVAAGGKQNFMDILTPSGFLLALSTVLRGDPRGFWCHFGIKCGSWSQMSQGTSGRSICTSLGNQDHAFVRDGNCMASRMCLLLLVVTALSGVWSVEQPSGSFLEFYPRFRWVLQTLGEGAVTKVTWHMRHYGAPTPKPHWAFANASAISQLYQGHYPPQFGLRLVELHDQVLATKRGMPQLPEEVASAMDTFSQMDYDDLWEDANLVECVRYVRGGTSLRIPEAFRPLLPTSLCLKAVTRDGENPAEIDEVEAMERELRELEAKAICRREKMLEASVAETQPELAELEQRVRRMVISGTMSLDTASTVLGYRITGCSPEKKKARTEEPAENPGTTSKNTKTDNNDGMSDRGPPNDCKVDTDDDEEADKEEPSGAKGPDPGQKSRAARNAKLRRLCQRKKNGSLKVPVWLHELWKAGNHTALAMQYEENGYDKDKFVTSVQNSIARKDRKTNSVEEGWYSKEDMQRVLHWNPKKIAGAIRACEANRTTLVRLLLGSSRYGGEDEYWVQVREVGVREVAEEREQRERRDALDDNYAGLDSMHSRIEANEAPAVQVASEATKAKETFRKFIDSVLSKSAKLRALIRDLVKTYDDPLATATPASCTSQIEFAQAMTEQFGEEAVAAAGVSEWANAGLRNSERDLHRVIKRQGLRLDVGFSEMRLQDQTSIDWIRPTTWLRYLVEQNLWFHLTGLTSANLEQCQATWSGYWDRFFQLRPDIDKPEGFDPQNTAAVYIHGDEGRTLKKGALMIMGFQSCLGYGCAINGRTRKTTAKADCNWQVNYAGHSYTTRFVTNIMSKKITESSFDHACSELAKDLSDCLQTGFTYRGVTYRLFVIACKGDWPFLLRAGHLARHFSRSVKKVGNEAKGKGICHLCMAGTQDYPAEECGYTDPKWLSTIPAPHPWPATPPLLRHLACSRTDPSTFYQPDLWHTVHLGVGKSFAASCITMAILTLPSLVCLTMERRWEAITADYLSWCKTAKRQGYVTKIGPSMVNYGDSTGAVGGWHKGQLTTNLLLWLECLFRSNANLNCSRIEMALRGAACLNSMFRFLYDAGAFLSRTEAMYVSRRGLVFLRCYTELAQLYFREQKPNLYPLIPKMHSMDHIMIQVHCDGERVGFAANPLSTGCQQDEDVVGRVSRVSRRVNIRQVIHRTFQRYLAGSFAVWRESGLVIAM
ncbi:unnamed protein product [Symbiodinium sp. CCMP2592]|nr:unnamed protein product [Symbiodinium sp. CCMP2592]